ncbi:MAG: D,D-heptose 1,7-bisphosphate phosphatase [Pirellula sp.]|nr:D,D-heptose 1,7-bisphosphate phosphatase [Pirellula sp.]
MRRGVFLDRDGVLIEDVELLVDPAQARILPGVGPSLARLRSQGFMLVVVTNQTVVARGLASEADVQALHGQLQAELDRDSGGVDAWYYCPHHPHADVAAYRCSCECRKPAAGMLRQAAERFGIDLAQSYMIGDRPTDIAAGAAAGCRTVLVKTGRHLDRPIVGGEATVGIVPDRACADLVEAAAWISEESTACTL